MTPSKYEDVTNFNFNIRKQHNTINICKLGCITGTKNNISQMAKIEGSETFYPRRKMTS